MSRHGTSWLRVLGMVVFGGCAGASDSPAGAPVTSSEAARTQQAAATPAEPADGGAAPAPVPRKDEAIVVGSSSIKSTFGRIIAADLERWGFEVSRYGIVSAGLARPDLFDLHQIVGDIPIGAQTAAVFLYVGVNDGQALWLYPNEREEYGVNRLPWHDPRWSELYTRRAQSLFRSICERGAQRAIVMLPVEVEKVSLERKMRRIRQLQARAAEGTSCAAAVSTMGDRLPYFRNGKPLRRRDGVHMSPYGAQVVWSRVRQRVKPILPLLDAFSAAPRVAEEDR